ncbi:hypothetical protein IWW42_004604 [Coemansia sp. RSA 1085]|nr:hypothetical protein IWW40_002572 [Coemansia sp. RSA 1250]KAJ2669401.1 hypothetical protein IWW42_004604 [Coemansia sp. RSA 1085]
MAMPEMLNDAAAAAVAAVESGDTTAGFNALQNYALHVPFPGNGDWTNWTKVPSQTMPNVTPTAEIPRLPAMAPDASMPGVDIEPNRPISRRRGTVPQEGREPRFFGRVQQDRMLMSSDGATRLLVEMYPQVDRGFFMSDSDWTCYRRNYFQVSCRFVIKPRRMEQWQGIMVEDGGQRKPIHGFFIAIAARVAGNGARVELVQHTPKRDKGPQMTPQPQPVQPGSDVPASFERLQFKTATANNGKRRAAQQYYVLELELLADCSDGTQPLVATIESLPIVVRGRSPGHYADTGRRARSGVTGASWSLSGGPMSASEALLASTAAAGSASNSVQTIPPPAATRAHSDMLAAAQSTEELSAALAAASADTTGFGLDADMMQQALSAMVPAPQDILARAHSISDTLVVPTGHNKPAHISEALGLSELSSKEESITLSMAATMSAEQISDGSSQQPG